MLQRLKNKRKSYTKEPPEESESDFWNQNVIVPALSGKYKNGHFLEKRQRSNFLKSKHFFQEISLPTQPIKCQENLVIG